jgi:sec-independent protein translocase protein TatA
MGGFSWIHLLAFGAIALLLFGGRGKLSDVMGDFAKGIKSFREGLKDDPKTINGEPANPAPSSTTASKDQTTVGR